MSNQEYVLKHYEKIARTYGLSDKSSMHDPFIRDSERDFILNCLYEYIYEKNELPKIVDFGCGNGHLIESLKNQLPELDINGLEFSPELYQLCLTRNLNTLFIHDDLRSFVWPEKIDMAITERVIINLLSWNHQLDALKNIHSSLKSGGYYICIESFKDSLNNLNEALYENNFETIKPSKHNRFLQKGFLEVMNEIGFEKIHCDFPSNYLSTHFFHTRIIHPMMMNKGSKVKNSAFSRFLDDALPSAIGNYSPIQFHLFKKR
jgi:SAM-dependent methyltransferase